MNRIMQQALNSKRLKDKLMDTSHLIAELNVDYARAMNRVVFDTLQAYQKGNLPDDRIVGGNPRMCDSLDPNKTAAARDTANPALAVLAAPHSQVASNLLLHTEEFPVQIVHVPLRFRPGPQERGDFAEAASEFAFHTLYSKPEVLAALTRVRVECFKAAKLQVLQTSYQKAMRLEEYEQLQVQGSEQAATYVRDTWSAALKNAIRGAFRDVGKGWFNLAEGSLDTYQHSKMKRFLTLVRLIMQDSLRSMLLLNLSRLMTFTELLCDVDVHVASVSEVHVAARNIGTPPARKTLPGVEDDKPVPNPKQALLMVELSVRNNVAIVCGTDLDTIPSRMVTLFDHSVKLFQNLPQVEQSVMDNIFWAYKPVLNTLHPAESVTSETRTKLEAHWRAALGPVRSYVALFREYEAILQLDIQQLLDSYESKEEDLTLAEVRGELARQNTLLANLTRDLPSAQSLGAVHVSAVKVREAVLTKQSAVVAGLRGLLLKVAK